MTTTNDINDINNLDTEDIGLKQIFGERFHDNTEQKPETVKPPRKSVPKRAENAILNTTNSIVEDAEDEEDVVWTPFKPDPNFFDRLKACAKWAVCCGGLNILFFYWQQTGQMLPSAAVPSMCVCFALAGWGIGRNATKK